MTEIKFENDVPEEFLCTMCNNINKCIYRNINNKSIIYCDKCKETELNVLYEKDDLLTKVIQNYIIYCPNVSCKKKFIYKNLSSHLENECCFTYKTCPNIGCNYSALTGYYSHNSCSYREINNEFVSLQRKNMELNEKVNSLKNENKELNDKINLLQIENKEVNDCLIERVEELELKNTSLNFIIKKMYCLRNRGQVLSITHQGEDTQLSAIYNNIINSFYNVHILNDTTGINDLLKNKPNDIILVDKSGRSITLFYKDCVISNVEIISYGYYSYIFTDTPFTFKKGRFNYTDIFYGIINKDNFPDKYIFKNFDIDNLIMFIKFYYANPSIKRQDILFFNALETTERDTELLEEHKELIDEFDKKKVNWYIYIPIKNSTGMTDYIRNELEKYNFIKFI